VIPLAVPLADENGRLAVEFPDVVWILVGAVPMVVGAEVSVAFDELVGGGTSVERVALPVPVRAVVGKPVLALKVLDAPVPTKLLDDVVVTSDVKLPDALLPDARILEIKLTKLVLEVELVAAAVVRTAELVVKADPVPTAVEPTAEETTDTTELRSEVTSLRMLLTPTKIPVDVAAELGVVVGAAVVIPVPVPVPVTPETTVEAAALV